MDEDLEVVSMFEAGRPEVRQALMLLDRRHEMNVGHWL